MSLESTSSMAPSPATVAVQRSPWHSPVPYLFGGLAAMLGLIAFALLILACSYWKLSGYLDNPADGERDLESGNGDGDGESKPDSNNEKAPAVFEEKYLVIMAGEANPTFLATPTSSRTSSFGSSGRSNSTAMTEISSTSENEKDEQGSSDQVQVRTMENHATADQHP